MSRNIVLALDPTVGRGEADDGCGRKPRAGNGGAASVLTFVALSLSAAACGAASASPPNTASFKEGSKPQATAPVAHTKASEKRNVSENSSEAWTPSDAQVAKVEALLAQRQLVGAPLQERVRLYSGTIEGGRRYIVGMLLTPNWHGGQFDPRHRDENIMQSWQSGKYIVPLSKFPAAVSYFPDNSCEKIMVIFDILTNTIRDHKCIK